MVFTRTSVRSCFNMFHQLYHLFMQLHWPAITHVTLNKLWFIMLFVLFPEMFFGSGLKLIFLFIIAYACPYFLSHGCSLFIC